MTRRFSRYPVTLESAPPGKLVRTRQRPARSAADTDDEGTRAEPISYLGRSLLPLPETLKKQSNYTIQAGDRLDNVSAKLLGDPLLYWMLLEANGTSDPATLCATPGRTIIVPASVGQGVDPFDEPLASKRNVAAAPQSRTNDADETP